ncbi:peptidoglycan recognition protein family protein [Vallitalea okinawensis]|uniref:peptidoglycan recognition protein family protein n=1 Tax=Vallitalea okinawensis TaxID=2078660 RepID=UPI000CFD558C|nr:N-acetylmuramoyl-L-alanine amidase [Vallitalea okinawensis]
MKIIEDFIPKGHSNRPGIAMNPLYICIYDTGMVEEGTHARMLARHMKTINQLISWHYTVDDMVILQHLPLSEVSYQVSQGDDENNDKSIGIAICMNEDGDRHKAEENAIELVIYLVKKYNIPIEKVVQYNHWVGEDFREVLKEAIS